MLETIGSYVLSLLPDHPRVAANNPLCADYCSLLSPPCLVNARSSSGAILVWICGKGT